MRIFMAAWLTDRSLGSSLTKKRASRRLLSYHFLKEQEITQELFTQYIQTGRCDPRVRKEEQKFYYYHPESNSLWSSNRDPEHEGNADGCTESVTRGIALKIQKDFNMIRIPHYNH